MGLHVKTIIVIAGIGLATAGSPLAGQNASIPAPAPRADSLPALLARLQRMLAPIVAYADSMEVILRPDSGTLRADTVFLQLRETLERRVRPVSGQLFGDSIFQLLAGPDGVRGYQLLRQQQRRGLPVDSIDQASADSLDRFLRARGLWAFLGEGIVYVDVNRTTLLQRFGRFVTPAIRDYLRILALEQARPTGHDAAIGISWDELGERLAATDRWLALYPAGAARKQVSEIYIWYLRPYIDGWDNTLAFRRGVNTLEPTLRQSFERYAVKNAALRSGKLIADYMRILRANGYRRTEAVVAFQRRTGIHNH